MKDKFRISYTRSKNVTINREEAKELVKQFLEDIVGENCYIDENSMLLQRFGWEGNLGTVTNLGPATDEQEAASVILKFLSE